MLKNLLHERPQLEKLTNYFEDERETAKLWWAGGAQRPVCVLIRLIRWVRAAYGLVCMAKIHSSIIFAIQYIGGGSCFVKYLIVKQLNHT
jgi:hypothetical protein